MTTLEENIAALEQALSASTDNDDEDQKRQIRMATVRQAAEEMSDEEKKEARAAMGEDHTHLKRQMKRAMGMEDEDERNRAMKKAMDMLDDKEKKAMDEDDDDDDEKDAMDEEMGEKKKPKMSMEDEDEKDKKIASLTASLNFMISKPFVDQMLKARQEAGMPPKELQKFKRSLYGKSIAEIKARHAEDKALYTKTLPKPLIAAEEPDNELMFNAGFNAQTPLSASTTSSESVEAMFD